MIFEVLWPLLGAKNRYKTLSWSSWKHVGAILGLLEASRGLLDALGALLEALGALFERPKGGRGNPGRAQGELKEDQAAARAPM